MTLNQPLSFTRTVSPSFTQGTNIVSLAASLAARFTAPQSNTARSRTSSGLATGTAPLADEVFADALASAQQAVFVLIDGLGVQPLAMHAPSGALSHFKWRTLDSVFPSSTAPALSSLSTAAPPAMHGNPAWLMWSEQLGETIRTLPMNVSTDHTRSVAAQDVWEWRPWMCGSAAPAFSVLPFQIADSVFSRYAYAGSTIVGYHRLDEICEQVEMLLDKARGPASIFVYLPHFDTVSHLSGCASEDAHAEVHRLDAWFGQLVERLCHRDVLVFATADHGFIDIAAADQLRLEDFPVLAACLERPLSGEPRVPFCQVRATAREDFIATVAAELGDAFTVHTAEELLKAGWFGKGDALAGRLGTHILVPQRPVTLIDTVADGPSIRFFGMHGGPSEAEMHVPLIVAWRGNQLK